MEGFKNSTKTQYFKGGASHEAKGAAKVAKVMGEFKSGKLHSGSKNGPEVTSRKQATAIAMSEARKAGAKMPMRKNEGGSVEADDALMARMTPAELAMGAAGVRAARARLAKEPASGPAKKLPPKAVPVAPKGPLIEVKKGYGPASSLSIKLKNGGPVKKAVGGPAAAAPVAQSGAGKVMGPAEIAAERQKQAGGGPRPAPSTPVKPMVSNRLQAEKSAAAKAALAPKLAENARLREANAAARAQRQQYKVKLDQQAAAKRQKKAEVNQRQTALGQQPIKRPTPTPPPPTPTPILETPTPKPPLPPVQYKRGGLAAMPKGKC